MAGAEYDERDRQRLHAEPAKGSTLPGTATERDPFTRDRARVLHSAALRRLAGKTQVVGPGEGAEITGAPRTRLTHSIEVAQIGREIAGELGCDPDVVDTAGLAHDIGHPPFGHNGEAALDAFAADAGGFEGNAQSLRILTRLEPKVIDSDGHSYGLNLTRATLDAVLKYPWPRRGPGTKFGVYQDDLPVFDWIRQGTQGKQRCVEAQIMDFADDVAYSVHDVEDGIAAGRISLAMLADPVERTEIARLAKENFADVDDVAWQSATLESAAAQLLELPVVAELASTGYDGTLRAQVALKRLTSELLGRFAAAAVTATRQHHGDRAVRRYTAELVVPQRIAAEVALLKAVALRYVMSDETRLAQQRRQRELLTELACALRSRAPRALQPALRPAWLAANDDASALRVIIDQVASLTDAQAVHWHRQLT